jgi:hypothetical protein
MSEQEGPVTDCTCGEYHTAKCPVARALRDCWSTPQNIADIVGPVDLDPCSNERSVIDALTYYCLEDGQDGLEGADRTPAWATTFVNCPYSAGQVIKWVLAYRHTRFIYLLRWDPSTEWFRELIGHCTHVWFPPFRVSFVPPPRIKASSNPFPHALYLRDPGPELLARLRREGVLVPVDEKSPGYYGEQHGHQHADRDGSEGPGGGGTEATAGDGGGWCDVCGAALATGLCPNWEYERLTNADALATLRREAPATPDP